MWFGCHSYAISARCNWNGWDVSIPLCTTILCVGAVRAWASAHATPVAIPVLESNGNYHTSLSLPARGLNAAGRSSRVTPRYVGRVLEIRKISEQAIALGRARTRKAQQTVVSNPLLANCESTPLRSDERGYSALVLQEDARDR